MKPVEYSIIADPITPPHGYSLCHCGYHASYSTEIGKKRHWIKLDKHEMWHLNQQKKARAAKRMAILKGVK